MSPTRRSAPLSLKQDLANSQSIQFYEAAAVKQSEAQGQESKVPHAPCAARWPRSPRARTRKRDKCRQRLHQMRILPSALQSKLRGRRSLRLLALDVRPRTPASPPTLPFGALPVLAAGAVRYMAPTAQRPSLGLPQVAPGETARPHQKNPAQCRYLPTGWCRPARAPWPYKPCYASSRIPPTTQPRQQRQAP